MFRTVRIHSTGLGNRVAALWALVTIMACSASGQPDPRSLTQEGAVLTITVLGEQYCSNGQDSLSMVLKVRLELANNGDPFEVYLPPPSEAIVSRTLEDASAKKHEAEINGPEAFITGHVREHTFPEIKRTLVATGEKVESIDDS